MTGVVGIDLSLTSTGMCAVKDGKITDLLNIKTKGKKSDTLETRRERLFDIANEIIRWVENDDTDLVVIEAPSYGSRFGSAHDRSGLWWAVVSPIIGLGIPLAQVSPQGRAKYGTGRGNSKKDVVFAHVLERYSDLSPQRIANDDLADAVLLASIGSRHLGYPVEPGDLPQANLDALSGVQWATT